MNRKEVVLIIDFGGSEAQLLARRVRELEVLRRACTILDAAD